MGFVTSDKMLPLVVMRILLEETDAEHPITLELLCERVTDYYEPAACKWENFKRKIARLLDEMMDFFETAEAYNMGGTYSVRSVTVPDKNGGRSHEKCYYIAKRLFTEEELRLLCDSVCFSPGLSINDAKHMIEKLTRLASKSFNNIFRFVFYSDIIFRTNNEKVFENLRIISEAISRNCKVAVYYKERATSTVISPFFLVISMGKYYVLSQCPGKSGLAPYRLDRISRIELVANERRIVPQVVDGVDRSHFELSIYMKKHPRMYFDNSVETVLLVRRDLLEAVRMEFYVLGIREHTDTYFRVKIQAPKAAILNWIVNMTGLVMVVEDYGSGLVTSLQERAVGILEAYGG